MPRPLHAEVNLAALRDNLARARRYAEGAEVLAVVKANAYGHGLVRVLPALAGADGLALLELDAAAVLREHGWDRRILLLEGFFTPAELPELAAYRLATAVHDENQVRMLELAAVPRPLEIFLKVATGMNRLGVPAGKVRALVERLERCRSVSAIRLMTHLARAEAPDGLADPLAEFATACRGLPHARSMANSAGVVRFGEVGGQFVRPGIMLYGATPFADRSAAYLGLRPVMTLRAQLIAVRELEAGAQVGYGGTYAAPVPHRLGVVACGYADGYPRHAPNGTPVLVCGQRVPIAGRVSMDMLTVDLSKVPEADVGSPVVLWGDGLPVDEVAAHSGTIGYELLCAVAPRVPFMVTDDGPSLPG